jgi:hypothetical protein
MTPDERSPRHDAMAAHGWWWAAGRGKCKAVRRWILVAGTVAATLVTPCWVLAQPLGEREAAFLAGATLDCVGCDIAGVCLKRSNIAWADLSYAILEDMSFHAGNLVGAIL